MRKYFLFLIPLLYWGCEKTYDNVIDTSSENYQVSSIAGIKDTVDLKVPGDSLLTLRLIFTPQSVVNKSYFDIFASDNSQLNSTPVEMQEVSDNVFQNQFILTSENPNGNYNVKFSVTGFDGQNKQVASGSFYFNNGQDNISPVISNVVIPDSIAREQTFIFTIEASDSNGGNDIAAVFFNLFRPDTSLVTEGPFLMHDDGNYTVFGDSIAGDGIYSFKNLFAVTAQTGNWHFEFQAIDRSYSLSNIIDHYMIVY